MAVTIGERKFGLGSLCILLAVFCFLLALFGANGFLGLDWSKLGMFLFALGHLI